MSGRECPVWRGRPDRECPPVAPTGGGGGERGVRRTIICQPQPDNPALYPLVPAASGYRADLATYTFYADTLPDVAANQSFAQGDKPVSRGWCAQLLWQALDSYFGQDRVP